LFGFAVCWCIVAAWRGLWKIPAAVLGLMLAAQTVIFASQFETESYKEHPYDASAQRVVRELIRVHKGQKIRVGSTGAMASAIDYYRLRYKLNWLEPLDRKGLEGKYDYYYYQAEGENEHLATTRGLSVLYFDPRSKAVLAAPEKSR
jgi:hypothetical protein